MKFKLGCLVVVTGLVAFCGKKAADTAVAKVTAVSCTSVVSKVDHADLTATTNAVPAYSQCVEYKTTATELSAAFIAAARTECGTATGVTFSAVAGCTALVAADAACVMTAAAYTNATAPIAVTADLIKKAGYQKNTATSGTVEVASQTDSTTVLGCVAPYASVTH